jgi:putative colanic acid biosynthesis acetyltransferase WcaF
LETSLNKFENSWYWKNYNRSSFLKRVIWFFASNIFLNSYLPIPIFFKIFLLRLFGAEIGQGVVIKPKVNVKYPWLLTIGDYSWIGEEVWIDNLAMVKIGKNVCISQGAMLLTGNHDFSKPTFDLKIGNITLEDGVWIGAKAIVCPGVTCFSHSVLAVGSVASKNLEANIIYRGNPAIQIKSREIG